MMNRVVLFGFFFTLLYILASSLPQEVNRKVKTKEHYEKRLTGNEQKKESQNKKKTFTKGQLGSKRKAGKKGRRRPRQGKTNKGKAKRNSSKKNSAKKHKTTKKKDKLKHENANNINVIKNTQRKRKAIKKKKQEKRKKAGKIKSSTNGKASQNWSVSDSCFANATASLQIRRTLVQNFERQRLRFERFRKVTKGKSMKGNFFTTAALKIMSAGGGNMTGLSCHNVAKSVGAKDMKSVVEELLQCEENIQKSCNYAAIAFTNQTKVSLHGWFRLEDMIFSFRLMNVMPMSRISIPW